MKKLFLITLLLSTTCLIKAQVITIHNPEIVSMQLERISPALKDIPEGKEFINPDEEQMEHENPSLKMQMESVNPNARPVGEDPARQMGGNTRDSSDTELTLLSNWEGVSDNIQPSDNCLAVGPDHVMQMVNNSVSTYIRVWDKAGNILINKMKVQDFSGINDCGDPNVIYDELADRYVFILLYSCSTSKLEVCVSQTGDPTGAWYVYSFTTTGGFPDYPKISLWGDSYFITTNSNSPTVWAMDRTALLTGNPLGTVQKFALSSFPQVGFQSASPVNFTGATLPPDGSPAVMVRVADDAWGGSIDSDHLEIFEAHIDWVTTSNSSISGPLNLPTADYNSDLCGFNSWQCIPQPNTNQKLDPLGNIVMDKVQYRNFDDHEAIVCTHVVNADGDGTAGVRWYELRKDISSSDWYVYQQGTYSPNTDNRWMSSISINDDGAIALGYNVSSAVVNPGILLIGRASCDDLNLMATPETVGIEGTSYNNSNRYGDYNNMVTDPVNGSFWFTGNYNVTTAWSTNVSHFTISNCLATEVASINTENTLTISPVPATNELEISFHNMKAGDCSIELYDATGKAVYNENIQISLGTSTSRIDVTTLSNGIYFLRIQSATGNQTRKVVIER